MKSRELIFISAATGMGGGEHFAAELLRELKNRGWSITLVCPPAAPLLSEASLADLDARVAIDLSAKIRQPFRFGAALLRWMLFVRRGRTPLIYGNGFETLKWLAAAQKVRKITAIFHLHDSTFDYYEAPRTRRLSRAVQRFIAISETVRIAFHRGTGVDLDRIALVPNGVLPSPAPGAKSSGVRAEWGLSESSPLVVMVARTDPLKGHETLLRAIPAVLKRHPETRFVFVGVEENSPLEKKLAAAWRGLIRETAIGHAVLLLPYRADARLFLRAADVAVVPSSAEGFGRTAIEAMAEETALVASRVGGLAEIVVTEVTGLLVPPDDPPALADAIVRLLDDPALRRRLAEAGRKAADELYSTRVMVDRIETELIALIAESAPEGR
jgi:glycosyltransferase involved in cell wall biosynthesis